MSYPDEGAGAPRVAESAEAQAGLSQGGDGAAGTAPISGTQLGETPVGAWSAGDAAAVVEAPDGVVTQVGETVVSQVGEAPATAPSGGAAGLSGDPGRDEEEGAIFYPPQRGQETLARLGAWTGARAAALAQPEVLVTAVVVVACVVFTFWQFDPSLLFRNTTISGGDTGAHVLLPWVAWHQVLPHLRLTGWTSSNWDGFPAVTFYFPLPVYSIVAVAQLIGYNVAFKLLTAAPMFLMPVAGWLLGRLARAPFPVPAVLAAATLPFIFGTEFSIYGGNIPSTLAGEFADGWSLWFALVFLGLVMGGLQTGRRRAWAAVMFACAFMSHIDPAMFAAAGAVVLVLIYGLRSHDWRGAVWWSVPTLAVGGLLAGWWALPFYYRFNYVTNMGYGRNTAYLTTLFPTADTWLFALAGMGAVLSIARRRRMGEFFSIMAVLAVVAFRFMPNGILWNNRILPFWFLLLYLLGGLAVAELYTMFAERMTGYTVTLRALSLPGPLLVLILSLIWVGFPLRVLPGEHVVAGGNYEFLGIPQKAESYIPGWVTWNYSGYQAGCGTTGAEVPADAAGCSKPRWPEYTQIVAALDKLSKTYGCGPLDWEYQSEMNDYGTPDALTILPYWTNGCIGSMEGLYYEASATTPFHFINQSELSLAPSDPMVFPDNLAPYAGQANGGGPQPDVALGVEHLQMLGVKYYMALNTELQAQAAADPSLKLIDTLGPFSVNYSGSTSGPQGTQSQYWKVYLVLGAARVHALADQPVVMEGLNNAKVGGAVSQAKYLKVMVGWYNDPSDWDVYPASNGPSNWARVPYGDTSPPVKAEPATTVSHIVEGNASISFDVTRLGVPVVVTTSYFPNWQISGAEGVYRAGPNLMVVVPTSHHVRLWYGTTPIDVGGWLLSLLGLAGLVLLIRRPLAPVVAVLRPGFGRRLSFSEVAGGDIKGTWPGGWTPGTRLAGPPAWSEDHRGAPSHAYGPGEPRPAHALGVPLGTGEPMPPAEAQEEAAGPDGESPPGAPALAGDPASAPGPATESAWWEDPAWAGSWQPPESPQPPEAPQTEA